MLGEDSASWVHCSELRSFVPGTATWLTPAMLDETRNRTRRQHFLWLTLLYRHVTSDVMLDADRARYIMRFTVQLRGRLMDFSFYVEALFATKPFTSRVQRLKQITMKTAISQKWRDFSSSDFSRFFEKAFQHWRYTCSDILRRNEIQSGMTVASHKAITETHCVLKEVMPNNSNTT